MQVNVIDKWYKKCSIPLKQIFTTRLHTEFRSYCNSISHVNVYVSGLVYIAVMIDAGRLLGNRNARWSKGPGKGIQCLMPLSPTRDMLVNNCVLTPGVYVLSADTNTKTQAQSHCYSNWLIVFWCLPVAKELSLTMAWWQTWSTWPTTIWWPLISTTPLSNDIIIIITNYHHRHHMTVRIQTNNMNTTRTVIKHLTVVSQTHEEQPDNHTDNYDTIRKKSLTWTRKLSIQLYLAHVAEINIKKKKLKQTNISAPIIQYRLRSMKRVQKEIRVTMEERNYSANTTETAMLCVMC